MRTFIIGTGSCGYGGQEVPQFTVYKLKNCKGSGIFQPESEGLENRGADGRIPSLGRKAWEPANKSQSPNTREPGAPMSKDTITCMF